MYCENIALDAKNEYYKNFAPGAERKKLNLHLKFKNNIRLKLNDI